MTKNTRRTAMQAGIVVAAMGFGWAIATAQTIIRTPDFEIVVTAPTGETRIECVRGCELAVKLRDGSVNQNSTPTRTYTYGCGATMGCASGTVAGWIKGVF